MTTIYLVRHGQKDAQAGNPGLTTLGQKQAQETGKYLQQFPINKIFSSPLQRTMETAAAISQALNVPVVSHPALVERMNWENGIAWSSFVREWRRTTSQRNYSPPFGNSSYATGRRIEQLISSSTTPKDEIVLVTHGGAILDYLRNVFGDAPVATLLTQYEGGEDYQMLHCAINKVVLSAPPRIDLLNFVDHLSNVTE